MPTNNTNTDNNISLIVDQILTKLSVTNNYNNNKPNNIKTNNHNHKNNNNLLGSSIQKSIIARLGITLDLDIWAIVSW